MNKKKAIFFSQLGKHRQKATMEQKEEEEGIEMETQLENEKRRKVVRLFSGNRLMFS